MKTLYELTDELKKKYNYKSDETHLVRYHKFLFDELSKLEGNDYLELFSSFECGVEEYINEVSHYEPKVFTHMDRYRQGFWITLQDSEYILYLNFLENILLPNMPNPRDNTKVLVTTFNGGTHLSHYFDGKFNIRKSDGSFVEEDKVIIYWQTFE